MTEVIQFFGDLKIQAHNDPQRSLMGAALKPFSQSHYVVTNRKGDVHPLTGPDYEYDELVIPNPYQALPIALISLDNTNSDWKPLSRNFIRPLPPPKVPNGPIRKRAV